MAALSIEQFASYKPGTSLGLSLAITAPTGLYNSGKILNLGSDRWSFTPEIALSHPFGPGTTARNGQEHFDVLPGDPLTASFDECVSGSANQIGHLQRSIRMDDYRLDRDLSGWRWVAMPLRVIDTWAKREKAM